FLDPICQLIRLERTRLHTARQHPHELCRAEPGLFELNRVLLQRVQEVVVGRECVPLPERDQIPRLLPLKAERLNERRRLSEYLVDLLLPYPTEPHRKLCRIIELVLRQQPTYVYRRSLK